MAQESRTGFLVIMIVTLSVFACSLSGCFGRGDPSPKYSVSGKVVYFNNPAKGIPGVTLHFSGHSGVATTYYDGDWSMDGLQGEVIITPALEGWVFEPRVLKVSSAASNLNFRGTRSGNEILVPEDYSTIQSAIDAAHDGDTVLVAQGTYRENIDFRSKEITVRSANPLDPAVVAQTVIDGGYDGPTVVFRSGETPASVLEGLTITNGYGSSVNGHGGGISIYGSSPVIRHNSITGNTSVSEGGGIHIRGGSPIIENNVVSYNECGKYGAGVCVHSASPSLVSNRIEANSGGNYGGGVCVYGGALIGKKPQSEIMMP